MTTYSVLVPRWPQRPGQILPYAALAQQFGGRLWSGQGAVGDAYQAFVLAAAAGFSTPVGLGVQAMPFLPPFTAALHAQSAAVLLGHSVVAGFGPAAPQVQRALLGSAYRRPLDATREYLTIVRELLEQGSCDRDGDYFRCHAVLPELAHPPIRIGAGVLRPRMARLAGELADVAICWLTPARYLAETIVPALRAGAEAAGRQTPTLTAVVPVALCGDARDATELAAAACAPHLALPQYQAMLRAAGVAVDPDSAQALVRDGAFLFGERAELAARLAEFAAAGVDEVVLNVTGVHLRLGADAAVADLRAILGG